MLNVIENLGRVCELLTKSKKNLCNSHLLMILTNGPLVCDFQQPVYTTGFWRHTIKQKLSKSTYNFRCERRKCVYIFLYVKKIFPPVACTWSTNYILCTPKCSGLISRILFTNKKAHIKFIGHPD